MKPEEKARQKIDQLLGDAGWEVQDYKNLNLGASLGVAIREFPLKSGFADYLLFIDRTAAGVIEAKPEGTTLTSAEYQSDKYLFSLPKDLQCFQKPLPFAYESTG
jgi:type I restriction enzyme R subunit